MKSILSILLSTLAFSAFCQIKFEKGYIIDNSGNRLECLVYNIDWLNNPDEIKYKLLESSSPLKGDILNVKEFGVYNYSKYVRANVEIDLSPNHDLQNFSKSRNPEWVKDTIFLKVLIEGKANLYFYEKNGLTRFFYKKTTDSSISQLIFKEYQMADDKQKIYENNYFRQQLFNELKCTNISQTYIERISYKDNELIKYFKDYNKCNGDVVIKTKNTAVREMINFKITPGINYSSLSCNFDDSDKNVKFDNGSFFRSGLEIEFVFPFNKNKWSFFLEPTYQYFRSRKINPANNVDASINYKSVEFPIGIRHYFFLNDKSKIYINAVYLPSWTVNIGDKILAYGSTKVNLVNNITIRPGHALGIGVGCNVRRFTFEARYINQDLTSRYSDLWSHYKKFSFIFGYKFLSLKSKVVK